LISSMKPKSTPYCSSSSSCNKTGCFYPPGDTKRQCYSTCVHGYPEDESFKLYNPVNALNCGERGITLYENYGLDETRKTTEMLGEYSSASSLLPDFDAQYLGGVAVSNLGRKVVLYGNVQFALSDFQGLPQINNMDNRPPYSGYTTESDLGIGASGNYQSGPILENDYVSLPDSIANSNRPFLSGMFYKIKFIASSKYNGNSAIEFHGLNNSKYRITNKNDDFLQSRKYIYANKVYTLTYVERSDQDITLWMDAAFWFIIPNIVSGTNILYSTKSIIPSLDPNKWNIEPNSSNRYGYTQTDEGDLIYLCPVSPVSHAYDGYNSFAGDNGKNLTSGFKSMYIPPHMQVNGFLQSVFYSMFPADSDPDWQNVVYTDAENSFQTCERDPGEVLFYPNFRMKEYTENTALNSPDENANKLPLTFDDSGDHSGTFYSFGTNIPNSAQSCASSGAAFGYSGFYPSSKYSNTAGIYNCALAGMNVSVRTDSSFTNDYFDYYNNATASVINYMFPEIVLNPNFNLGGNFISNMSNMLSTKTNPMIDIQKVRDATLFWDPTYNQATCGNQEYYDSSGVVPEIDMNTSVPPEQCLASMYSSPRINSFDIVNGIYSLEWIYVLYNCAMSCQGNPTISEDGNYVFSSSACKECHLFNNPKYYAQQGETKSTQSDSLVFVNSYCGFRNLTMAYGHLAAGGKAPPGNECFCQVNAAFCPAATITECSLQPDAISYNYYVGDNISSQNCTTPDNYCTIQNLQFEIANNGENTGTTVIGGSTCSTSDTTDGTEPDTTITPVEDDDEKNWWILLLIFFIVLVLVMIFYGVYRFKRNKEPVS